MADSCLVTVDPKPRGSLAGRRYARKLQYPYYANVFAPAKGCSSRLIPTAGEAMGASCCKSAADDGPEPVQASFGSSRKEFARSPLKGPGSDAQFSAESTPRKVNDGSIAAPHDRYDRDTAHSNLGIESKSTTSEVRSASSSTSSHEYCGPAPDPLCVSKLSTIHSASLSHPDRSPQSDASPLSHFPTGPSLASPRVQPVLPTSPTEVAAVNAFDSIGDVELPDDVFVRRNSAPADDSDAVKVSPRGTWEEDPAEVTAAFGVGANSASVTNLTALNGFPASGPKSERGQSGVFADGESLPAGPDLKVHLPRGHEFLSDAAASRMLAQTASIMSSISDCDSVTVATDVAAACGGAAAAIGMDISESQLGEVDAELDQACVSAPARGARALDSPFIHHAQAPEGPEAVGSSVVGTTRRTVSGGVVTGVRGMGRGARGGRGRGGLTSRDRALHTAPEPGRGAGGRVGARGRGGRAGQTKRGGGRGTAGMHLDSVGSMAQDDPLSSVTSMPDSRSMQQRSQPGRGAPRANRAGSGLAPALGQSNSAFSLPGYQGTNSLTDSQMAELQANGFTPTASPSGHSPAHYFAAPQQFMPGAWGMMSGSPMMGNGMVMPGSPGMMPGSPAMMPGSPGMMGGFQNNGVSRGGTPSAASPSSASSQRQGLSPELAALLGRDGQLMQGRRGSQMQNMAMQKKMMRQHRRLNSMGNMGSMPMSFTSTPSAMAQLQMAAQQQQMALQMAPMGSGMMMSPQHSHSNNSSSFSLNQPMRQGMHMRSGSHTSSQHHSMSPHPTSHHSASPQHFAMGGRHVSKGSSDASSGGAAAPANRKRGGAQAARPATAGAVPGRGFGGATAAAAARRQAAAPRRTGGGMHQKSASVAGGLASAGTAAQPPMSAYAQGGLAAGAAQQQSRQPGTRR
eukprot:jgi/Ulvmu1/6622/UM003_0260.1